MGRWMELILRDNMEAGSNLRQGLGTVQSKSGFKSN